MLPPPLIVQLHMYILSLSSIHTYIYIYMYSLSCSLFNFRVDVMFFFIVISSCCCFCIATHTVASRLRTFFFPIFRFCMTSIRFSAMLSGLSISISFLLHFLLALSKITAVTQRESERQTAQREHLLCWNAQFSSFFLWFFIFNFEFNVIYLIFGDVSCLWLQFVQNACVNLTVFFPVFRVPSFPLFTLWLLYPSLWLYLPCLAVCF